MSSPGRRDHPADGAALEVNLRPVATAVLVAVRLRQHDLLVRGHVVRDGAVARPAGAVRRRRPASSCSASRSSSASALNAIVSPILGALSDRGGRRLPFLLAVHRCCASAPTALIALGGPLVGADPVHRSRTSRTRRRSSTTTRRSSSSARPATRGRTVGHRRRDRVLRHGVRRAAAVLPRHPGRRCGSLLAAVLYGAVRDPDLPRRQGAARPRRAARSPSATSSRSWAQLRLTIAPRPRRSRACRGSCSAGSSTRTRSTR